MKALLRSTRHPAAASAIVALVLIALLYGDALTLPLFSDDAGQIPWVESVSWREMWSTTSPYKDYRPLWFTVWRVWGRIAGGLHPPGLHFLNLAAHFTASWLVGLLAAAWIRPGPARGARALPACLATALFAAFPFSRQAVAWASALSYPVVTALALGAVLAYDRARHGHGSGWIGLALLLAALAPFGYESGLLVAPLVLLAEGVGWLQHRWPRRSWWPLALVGLFAATTLAWCAMRGSGVTGFGLNLPDLQRNAGYLVQGMVYPTAPLAQWLAARSGLDPTLGLWLVALPTLALLAWSGLRSNRGPFWLGSAWFALFALPPMVSMEADWLALAPRSLYMIAAGVSLVWAASVSAWVTHSRAPRRAPVRGPLLILILTLTALLAPALVFVRDGMHLYEMAGQPIWDAAQAAQRGATILLVNLPMRITPRGRIYPLGFEGITPLPARVIAEELIYVHTGIHDAAQALAFGIAAVDEPPGYTYQLFGQPVGWEEMAAAVRQTGAIYLTRYEPRRIHLVEAGGAIGEDDPRGDPLARFGGHVALLDAACTCDEDGQVHLTAQWRVEATVRTDATMFVHLLDPESTLVAQADGYPLLGMLPLWLWEPGEVVRDVRHFDPVPAGEYTVRLGMWELATGEDWPAAGYADGIVPLSVRCP
jgi:hypothetical protein